MYQLGENFFSRFKDFYAKADMEPGDYSYDPFQPRVAFAELSVKPRGKAEELSIKDA